MDGNQVVPDCASVELPPVDRGSQQSLRLVVRRGRVRTKSLSGDGEDGRSEPWNW